MPLTRETRPPLPAHLLVNNYRTARVAEVLADFRNLQYYIAAAPVDPTNPGDYYTEGWAALRQCALDGQHILNCGADVSVPQSTGHEEEQAKAELRQCVQNFLSFYLPSLLGLLFWPFLDNSDMTEPWTCGSTFPGQNSPGHDDIKQNGRVFSEGD